VRSPQVYTTVAIAVAVVVLAILAVLLVAGRHRKGKALTGLTGVAFAFVLGGVLFGENRLLGYGLLGIGVALAVVDMARKWRANRGNAIPPQG
jgi:lipopolysaccharide export LptBFGC system permease protein LptF